MILTLSVPPALVSAIERQSEARSAITKAEVHEWIVGVLAQFVVALQEPDAAYAFAEANGYTMQPEADYDWRAQVRGQAS